jgi:tetratricopeptide (TPR) repeat protein
MSLNNLAIVLSDVGKSGEALDKAQEAARIYQRLAQTRPDAFLPDLAVSFGARGSILQKMGRHFEAAESFAQGIRSLAPLFQRTPTAFSRLIATLCAEYLRAVQLASLQPDAALLAPVQETLQRVKDTLPKER